MPESLGESIEISYKHENILLKTIEIPMNKTTLNQSEIRTLEIGLGSGTVSVSNLSSLLRVLQVTLREVGKNGEDTRDSFSEQPHPILHISSMITHEELILTLFFADARASNPMLDLSNRLFTLFMERFGQFIKELPQRGLWGQSGTVSRHQQFDSEVNKRLDQLRIELRRFPGAKLKFNEQTILFEGDRMEIQ